MKMLRAVPNFLGLIVSTSLFGASVTWVAENPDNDLQVSENWSSGVVPQSPDTAVFDSTIENVSTEPIEQSTPFLVFDFLFPNEASPFIFSFDNQPLTFFGTGITGNQTNTSIYASNNNNASSLAHQILFNGASNTSGSAILTVSNFASERNTGGVGQQIHSVGSFSLSSNGGLFALNEGMLFDYDNGGNFAGDVSSNQIQFDSSVSGEDNLAILASNKGTFGGSNTISRNTVGFVDGHQFYCGGNFQAGNSFNISAQNMGIDSGQGVEAVNQNRVGVIAGDSIHFASDCLLGSQASISVSNWGLYCGTNTATGSLLAGLERQLSIQGSLIAGDSFTLFAENVAFDSGWGAGNDVVGSVSHQIQLSGDCALGNDASLVVANYGSYTGSNASSANRVGVVANQQFSCLGTLTAGDNFNLEIRNIGDCDTIGSGNQVSQLGSSQLRLANGCTLGNNAVICVTNDGYDTSLGSLNSVAHVNDSQVVVHGAFNAGSNLSFCVSNLAYSLGDSGNTVGSINGSQLVFQDALILGNGSSLSVFNDGAVSNSQILLNQGFTIAGGKATIQAWNDGNLGGKGISILGNSLGGNANISLQNNSLHIDTNLPTFTVGELNGNSTSTVQSKPTLIIDTDAGTEGSFAGVIQDFPGMASTLTKRGPGSQILLGINTYSGLTNIEEGALVLTGELAGDVVIGPLGALKGTWAVRGNVYNSGTLAPGHSIGTLVVNGNFVNNANYAVEVNGVGQSDLLVVNGLATLNGGTVVVSSYDGGYLFHTPYTILVSTNVVGQFDGVVSLSPLLRTRLEYDPTHVYLFLSTAIINAGKTHNQRAVARQLDTILDPNAEQGVLISRLVDLPLADARNALDSLSGYQHTDDLWIAQMFSHQFMRRLYDPLRTIITTDRVCECNPCCTEWTGWLNSQGGFTRLRGDRNAHSVKINNYEITAGAQKRFCNYLTVGLAGSYRNGHVDYKQGGHGKNDTWLAGFYGLYRPECYFALLDLDFGFSSNSIKRSIEVGTLDYKAHSKPKIAQIGFYGEFGIDYRVGCLLVQPFAGLEMGQHWRHHVSERERHGFGLSLKGKEWFSASSRLGMHLTSPSLCRCVEVSLDLAWNRLLTSRKNRIQAVFSGFGTGFSIAGIPLDSDSLDYALTLSKCFLGSIDAYLEFSGESWEHASNYSLVGGFEVNW